MRFIFLLTVLLFCESGLADIEPGMRDKLQKIVPEEIPALKYFFDDKNYEIKRREERTYEKEYNAFIRNEKTFEEFLQSIKESCPYAYSGFQSTAQLFDDRINALTDSDARYFMNHVLFEMKEQYKRRIDFYSSPRSDDRKMERELIEAEFDNLKTFLKDFENLPERSKMDLRKQFREFFNVIERSGFTIDHIILG